MVYKLYADIIPVKGYTRSLLFDLTKNNYWYISSELYGILTKEIDFEKLQDLYPDNADLLKSYKKFLEKNDLIFQVSPDEINAFPSISMQWHSPSRITNMIIDVDAQTLLTSLPKINREIGTLGVEAILFRCFSEKKLQELKKYIVYLSDDPHNRLRDIQLEISIPEKSNSKKTTACLREISKLPMISTVTVYTLNEELLSDPAEDHKIQYIRQSVEGPENCGIIHGNIDSINLEIISESIHHNSCLNCKLSIDSAGNIKNCPSMAESFGNIEDTTLEESLQHKDFKRYWNLTKDDIDGCKDCEFRYVCTDCRAYTERSYTNREGLDISKPLKCGYNPYTGEWEEWSTNPLKQKAIQYYGMEKFI